MCFTETWLHQDIPDNNVSICGFQTVQANRDRAESGKRKGGGLAVLVNNCWCNPGHINIKEWIFSPDIKLLAVGLRPYYLPREFSHTINVAVYVTSTTSVHTPLYMFYFSLLGLQGGSVKKQFPPRVR